MSFKDKIVKKLFKKNNNRNKQKEFVFSIVMPIYNTEKYLSWAIDSVLNQSFGFDKVQIVLIDDGSKDNSAEICKNYVKKYPNNIKFISQKNQGISAARNNGIDFADGDIINFLDSDDKLEPNALEEIYNHFNQFGDEIDVISIPRHTFEAFSVPMPFFDKYDKNRIVDIKDEYDFPITPINSAFIKRDAFHDLRFDKRVIISEDSLLVNKIILKKGKYGVVGTTKYLYRKRFDEDSTIDTKKLDKNYFSPRIEFYFKELINYSIEKYGIVLKYIQSVLMYDLKWFFLQNTEKNVLNEKELKRFHNDIYEVMRVIDDDIILSQDFSKFLKYHMLQIKYDDSNLVLEDGKIWVNNRIFDEISNNYIKINEISIENYSCILKYSLSFYSKDIKVKLFNNNKSLDNEIAEIKEQIAISNVFAHEFIFNNNITLNKGLNDISFKLEIDSNNYPLKVLFEDKSKLPENVKCIEDVVIEIDKI